MELQALTLTLSFQLVHKKGFKMRNIFLHCLNILVSKLTIRRSFSQYPGNHQLGVVVAVSLLTSLLCNEVNIWGFFGPHQDQTILGWKNGWAICPNFLEIMLFMLKITNNDGEVNKYASKKIFKRFRSFFWKSEVISRNKITLGPLTLIWALKIDKFTSEKYVWDSILNLKMGCSWLFDKIRVNCLTSSKFKMTLAHK